MHGDFHFPQWSYSLGGEIKLNDFNKASILTFNEKEGEYCYVDHCYRGSYRSPEDNRCSSHVNEGSDTFSLGNNFYALLTGFRPHYEWTGKKRDLYGQIGEGLKLPYIDDRYRNRSDVESTLVKLMEACWVYDKRERASVFDVLKELYTLRDRENARRNAIS